MFSSNSFDVYTRLVILKSLHITLDSTTLPGHLSDRTFFVTSAVTRFFSLLSVIDIDSVICLSPGDTSFVHFIALFGKAATTPCGKNGEE